jgi:hypothetical protein
MDEDTQPAPLVCEAPTAPAPPPCTTQAPATTAQQAARTLDTSFVGRAPSLDDMDAYERRVNPDAGMPTQLADAPAPTSPLHTAVGVTHALHSGLETAAPVAREVAHVAHSGASRFIGRAASAAEIGMHVYERAHAHNERERMRANSEIALDVPSAVPAVGFGRGMFDLVNHDVLGNRTLGEILGDAQYNEIYDWHNSLDGEIHDGVRDFVGGFLRPPGPAVRPRPQPAPPASAVSTDPDPRLAGPTIENAHRQATADGAEYSR